METGKADSVGLEVYTHTLPNAVLWKYGSSVTTILIFKRNQTLDFYMGSANFSHKFFK